MGYELLLQKGYQALKGISRDGSKVYRKIITLPNGGTQKLYAKVNNGQIAGYINKDIANLGDDCHRVRTTFSRANGDELRSYVHRTSKVDNGYTFHYGKNFRNSNNIPVYEELNYGSHGKIYDARCSTNYGSFEHIVHTDNYKGNAHRWIEIYDRNPRCNTASQNLDEWLNLPTNFSSIREARIQGWLG